MDDYYQEILGLRNMLPFPSGPISGGGFSGGINWPGLPTGWPGSNAGTTFPSPGMPGTGQPSNVGAPPPSQEAINAYQSLMQNPSQVQQVLTSGTWVGGGGAAVYGVGCDGRWTIMLLRNGQIVLMWVISASAFGNTTGLLFPAFTFSSFPTSSILAYKCY
ncbi:hypothetical protein [Pradoshia sp.]